MYCGYVAIKNRANWFDIKIIAQLTFCVYTFLLLLTFIYIQVWSSSKNLNHTYRLTKSLVSSILARLGSLSGEGKFLIKSLFPTVLVQVYRPG